MLVFGLIPLSFVIAGEGGVNGVEGDGVGFVVFVDIGFGFGVVRGGIGRIHIRSRSLLCYSSALSLSCLNIVTEMGA